MSGECATWHSFRGKELPSSIFAFPAIGKGGGARRRWRSPATAASGSARGQARIRHARDEAPPQRAPGEIVPPVRDAAQQAKLGGQA